MIVVVGDRPCPRVGVGGAGVGIGIHAVPQMRLVTIAAPYGLRFGCCLLRSSRATAAAAVSYHYSTATTTTNNDDGGGASYAGRLPRCMFNEPSSRSSLSSLLFLFSVAGFSLFARILQIFGVASVVCNKPHSPAVKE